MATTKKGRIRNALLTLAAVPAASTPEGFQNYGSPGKRGFPRVNQSFETLQPLGGQSSTLMGDVVLLDEAIAALMNRGAGLRRRLEIRGLGCLRLGVELGGSIDRA